MIWLNFFLWPTCPRVADREWLPVMAGFPPSHSPPLCMCSSGHRRRQNTGREWGWWVGVLVCQVIRSLQETVQASLISPHRPLRCFLPLLLHLIQGSGNPCAISPSLLGLYKHCWPVYASSTETQQGTVPNLASCCLLVSPPWEPE